MEPLFDAGVPKIVFWSVVGTLLGAIILSILKGILAKYKKSKEEVKASIFEDQELIALSSRDPILFYYMNSKFKLEIENFRHTENGAKLNSIYILVSAITIYQIEDSKYIILIGIFIAALFSSFSVGLNKIQDRRSKAIEGAMEKLIDQRLNTVLEEEKHD